MTRAAAIFAAIIVAASGSATTLAAQSRSAPSPYLPLDDVAYGFVDAAQARGLLRSLSALDRPYRLNEIRRAIVESDTGALGEIPRAWLRRIGTLLAKYDDGRGAWDRRVSDGAPPPRASHDSSVADATDGATIQANGGLMGTAQTNAVRDLVRSAPKNGAYPGAMIRIAAGSGPLVAAVRIVGDQRWKDDPQYSGAGGPLAGGRTGGNGIAGRVEEAYASWQLPLAQVFVGRMARNWGPSHYEGMLLGNAAYSYDQIAARLGNHTLHLDWVAARLNSFGDTARFFTARKIGLDVGDFEAGLSEAVVYSGIGQSPIASLSFPFSSAYLGMYNENQQGNLQLAGDIAWRAPIGLIAAQLFVDDYQLDRSNPKPDMYGATITAEGLPLVGAHRWFVGVTEIGNLVYRNVRSGDTYTQNYVSLGRAFTDYREVRVGADLAWLSSGTFRPYVAVRWQGTGTYTNPMPPESQWPTTATILQGPVNTIVRAAVESRLAWASGFAITSDIGVNHENAVNFVPGVSRVRLEGRLRVNWEPPSWARRMVLRAD